MKFLEVPQFPQAHYAINVPWNYLERTLAGYEESGLDLSPDFQRAHVWTEKQRAAYVEYVLRGGEVGRRITFNNESMHADWGKMVLIDGKQRLESVRKFMCGDLVVFGQTREEFGPYLRVTQDLIFQVCNLHTRAQILQLYLNINASGTPHTKSELDMVRALLKKETSNG